MTIQHLRTSAVNLLHTYGKALIFWLSKKDKSVFSIPIDELDKIEEILSSYQNNVDYKKFYSPFLSDDSKISAILICTKEELSLAIKLLVD